MEVENSTKWKFLSKVTPSWAWESDPHWTLESDPLRKRPDWWIFQILAEARIPLWSGFRFVFSTSILSPGKMIGQVRWWKNKRPFFRASIMTLWRENNTAAGRNFSRKRGSIWRTKGGSIYAVFSTMSWIGWKWMLPQLKNRCYPSPKMGYLSHLVQQWCNKIE